MIRLVSERGPVPRTPGREHSQTFEFQPGWGLGSGRFVLEILSNDITDEVTQALEKAAYELGPGLHRAHVSFGKRSRQRHGARAELLGQGRRGRRGFLTPLLGGGSGPAACPQHEFSGITKTGPACELVADVSGKGPEQPGVDGTASCASHDDGERGRQEELVYPRHYAAVCCTRLSCLTVRCRGPFLRPLYHPRERSLFSLGGGNPILGCCAGDVRCHISTLRSVLYSD